MLTTKRKQEQLTQLVDHTVLLKLLKTSLKYSPRKPNRFIVDHENESEKNWFRNQAIGVNTRVLIIPNIAKEAGWDSATNKVKTNRTPAQILPVKKNLWKTNTLLVVKTTIALLARHDTVSYHFKLPI